jgi:hypothetical protein
MSDVITKVGPHRLEDGSPCRVVHIEYGFAFGFDKGGKTHAWCCATGDETENRSRFRIVGEWQDPPAPPVPPEGFEIRNRDYKCQLGDKGMNNTGGWGEVTNSSWLGKSARELDAWGERYAPYYIASPIPKPQPPEPGEGWRLLEPSEQVEEGDEVFRPEFPDWGWRLSENLIGRRLQSHGCLYRRRIGPLPVEEPWVPTNELRWKLADGVGTTWVGVKETRNGNGLAYANHRLEQRWTRGTEEDWRPIPVTG